MFQLGWFSTGRDKAARDLLTAVQDSIQRGEIKAEIAFVFCSREPGEVAETDLFLKLVESCRIPLVTFSYEESRTMMSATSSGQGKDLPAWRLDYDREVMQRLQSFHSDLCVLAGYMLIVGPEMCLRYNMINLHPAAPGGPAGIWQEVIWQLIEQKAERTGVMMHLVTPELDKGPPVTYCTFSIRGKPFDGLWQEIAGRPIAEIKRQEGEANHLFQAIRRHGLARELPLIVYTIKAFSEGKVRITTDKKVVDARGNSVSGYDLTAEIDRQVIPLGPHHTSYGFGQVGGGAMFSSRDHLGGVPYPPDGVTPPA
ncbi:MAG: phosphoglycerate transporter [Chloroflexi bacterium]|nr:phosphoglycerate transporter [Chloroflexota bacterium]